jgi:hypothetical protein
MDGTMKIGASQQLSTIEMEGIKQFQTLQHHHNADIDG